MVPLPLGAGVDWDQATRLEARDFCRWLQDAESRTGRTGAARTARPRLARHGYGAERGDRQADRAVAGYAAATVAHCESVLRGFYDFHLEVGSGPMVNPFPLAR